MLGESNNRVAGSATVSSAPIDETTSEAARESIPASMSEASFGTLVPTTRATRELITVSVASRRAVAAGLTFGATNSCYYLIGATEDAAFFFVDVIPTALLRTRAGIVVKPSLTFWPASTSRNDSWQWWHAWCAIAIDDDANVPEPTRALDSTNRRAAHASGSKYLTTPDSIAYSLSTQRSSTYILVE